MEEKKLSPIEKIKDDSNYLRGTIKESLTDGKTYFSPDDIQLLKYHGSYQQDDRDIRTQLMREKKEKAFSMMIRSKIPGGKLNYEQYLIHDEIADKYGCGNLRITDRQGFQFHGVAKTNLKPLIQDLNSKLVTTKGACGDIVRNVMCSTAPLKEHAKLDLFPYAKAVSDQFLPQGGAYYDLWFDGEPVDAKDISEPIFGKTYLPRKFKIGMCYPHDNSVDIYTQDIGIVPEVDASGDLLGFNIVVGGGLGMTHGIATTYPLLGKPFCFVRPDELCDITKAIVIVQRDHGNRVDRKRARMKYLIEEKGLDWFRSEVEKVFGKKTEAVHAIHIKKIENYHGWHEQADGKLFFGLFIENGRVKDEGDFRLKSALRFIAQKFKCDFYVSANQDLILSGFEERQKKELEDLLTQYGVKLPNQISLLRRDSMACPAMPTCGLAISEAERALPKIMDDFDAIIAELGLTEQRIITRMTGCPNGCARPYNAEIAFVGKTVGTYNIYVGGNHRGDRLAETLAEKIPAEKLGEVLRPILAFYKEDRKKGEGFGTFCERVGIESLQSLVPSV